MCGTVFCELSLLSNFKSGPTYPTSRERAWELLPSVCGSQAPDLTGCHQNLRALKTQTHQVYRKLRPCYATLFSRFHWWLARSFLMSTKEETDKIRTLLHAQWKQIQSLIHLLLISSVRHRGVVPESLNASAQTVDLNLLPCFHYN